jgi:predicted RNase H-like HicB family nuclease
MICEILVKQTGNGFLAAIPGLPDCLAEAPSKEEAIAKVKNQAQTWAATGEFVRINSLGLKSQLGNGTLTSPQFLDDLMAAVKEVRAEIDADPNQP